MQVKSNKAIESEARALIAGLTPRRKHDTSIGLRDFAERRCALQPSPLVAAIYDASDGVTPTTIDDEAARRHFGCSLSAIPRTRPRTIAGRTGGRGGKTSRLVGVKALHAAWTVPLPTLARGEYASSLIVAPNLKLARQALSFCAGYIDGSDELRRSLVSAPRKDDIEIRRPDGKAVRIEILPATARGTATRARTLVFAALDEAEFFFDSDSGVVNDDDIYRSVLQRLVPGGQCWILSTPWIAHTGLLEKMLDKDWGHHAHALCFTGGTRDLNPSWDPDGSIERDLREQDPLAAQREIDGIPSGGTAAAFFETDTIDTAIDKTLALPRTAKPGEEVTAGGDMGFTSDAAALGIVHRTPPREVVENGVKRVVPMRYIVADLDEILPTGGDSLKPSETIGRFATRMRGHAGLDHLVADGHYRATVEEVMADNALGFQLSPQGAGGVSEVYQRAKTLLRERVVDLPSHPRLLAQLRKIKWRPNSGGTISIIKPRGKDGHCDLADAVVLALWEASGLPVRAPDPTPGTAEALQAQADEWWDRVDAGLVRKASADWWDAPASAGGIRDD